MTNLARIEVAFLPDTTTYSVDEIAEQVRSFVENLLNVGGVPVVKVLSDGVTSVESLAEKALRDNPGRKMDAIKQLRQDSQDQLDTRLGLREARDLIYGVLL